MTLAPFSDETADGGADYVPSDDALTGSSEAWTPSRPVKGRTPPHRVEALDGETVYRVAIENRPGAFATLDQHGLDLLAAVDVPLLTLIATPKGKTYVQGVRPFCRVRWVNLGRLIAGAEKGERVRYASGDSLDLRRSNLILQQTKAHHG